jgi:curli production assembly/transport component CsgF
MKRKLTLLGILILFAFVGNAQKFVYTPKNPSFGGNTFNYQWLMSSAQAQDLTKDETKESTFESYRSDPVDDFKESLNRQILSKLSRQLIDDQFGEEALKEGTYELGDYRIQVGNNDEGVTVNIVDNKTGATTDVTVPYF